MFGWTTSEPVRWAMRKLFKFILKKKLGKLILGDIDLNRLDVQLGEGVVLLNDVAFNIDYINEKLGSVCPLILKEGSIGSLIINMPWSSKGFFVEAEEVEIVISFCSSGKFPLRDKNDCSSEAVKSSVEVPSKETSAKFDASDVHEGVKTIANMVRMFLTNFQVQIKNLLVALDPYSNDHSIGSATHRTLVFRVSEIDCGACITETISANKDGSESFLGLSRLTNFVQFSGGFIELLQLNSSKDPSACPQPTLTDSFSENSLSTTWVVMNGLSKGVSGSLNLSIPWRNGSLDMQTLDGDVRIDPVEVYLRPSCISWLLNSWEIYQKLERVSVSFGQSLGSMYFDSSSHLSSTRDFSSTCDDAVPNHLSFDSCSFLNGEGNPLDRLLPEPNVIPDWVPSPFHGKSSVDQQEIDLGASMDQFFECFDEMKSSQSVLGASGMWNWTCSVFSALNVASSIASGSLIIAPEQRHFQTSYKVALTAMNVTLYFNDENPNGESKLKEDEVSDPYHCATAEFNDILICLEISPQELMFDGTINHLELSECMSLENSLLKPCSIDDNDVVSTINNVLYEVHKALPPSIMVKEPQSSCDFGVSVFSPSPLGKIIKIKFLSTEGVTHCQLGRSLSLSSTSKSRPNSLVLEVPPFMLWVRFPFITQFLNLLKVIEKSNIHKSVPSCPNLESIEANPLTSISCKYTARIPDAKVFFCFSSSTDYFPESYASYNHFLAIDILAPTRTTVLEKQVHVSSVKEYALKAKTALSLNIGNFKSYLVDPSEIIPGAMQTFSAKEIMSISNKDSSSFVFSLFCNENQSTGPWVVEKAKTLFFSDECWDTKKHHSCDFVTVTSAKDAKDVKDQFRDDIIMGSSQLIYINLASVAIDLTSSQFAHLQQLLDLICKMFFLENNDFGDFKEKLVSQVSLFINCKLLDVVIRPELQSNIRSSLKSELPGSWNLMKLKVQAFNALHVSNVGGLSDEIFSWVSHSEGKLTGWTDAAPENELLLISCLKDNRGRGDGGGSNMLTSRSPGFDFFHVKDSHSFHDFTSISLGCITLFALGGRLDWLDVVSSFFVVPSSQASKPDNENLKWTTSLLLKLTDVGLCYEPFSSYSCDQDARVSCLLAASSVIMSSRSVQGVLETIYKVQVRELALLLCWFQEKSSRTYSVKYLQEMGYAKIARESLLELDLKTICNDHQRWRLESTKSHVNIESFHDTTTALMQLADQLQQIYAPDLQNMMVHLQDRWNSHHHGGNESVDEANSFSCELNNDADDSGSRYKGPALTDEMCEIEPCVSGRQTSQWIGNVPVSYQQSFEGPMYNYDNSPKIIESYCVSDLRPLNEIPSYDGCKEGWYDRMSLNIVENYFSLENMDSSGSQLSDGMASDHQHCGQVVGRLSFQNMTVNWKICAGSYWENSNSSNDKKSTTFMDLSLSGVQIQYDVLDNENFVSKLSMSINDLYFYDLSANAPWKLVLGHYNSKNRPRNTYSKMVRFTLECVRPDPLSPLEEYRGQVALLPLLLHLQQNQLDFLVAHFGGTNLEKSSEASSFSARVNFEQTMSLEALLPYFQKFEICPFTLRVDYHPRSVDLAALTSGKYVELVNLVPWKGVELQLKQAEAVSAYGWGVVFETIIGEWLMDISNNQIHKILRGLPTIKSLVAFGTGATKLVSLPIESYKKDGKVIKGVQRGTAAFVRSISVEAVGLGVHLAAGVHEILHQAENLLTKIPSSGNISKVRCNQPKNAKQGIKKAYKSLSDGLENSANALIREPLKTYQRGGTASSVLTSVVKSVPGAAVAPVTACAGAAHYVLLGVRNSLDPEHKKESLEKYRGPSQDSD